MIITIHAPLDIDTARLTRAQRLLVGYLCGLHERQGDVLLFSVRRAVVVTGMEDADVQDALHGMVAARAIELEAA